ncbi:MAG: hypothetical protein F2881_10565 [Actinobacteria bacterium]|uniref:Unannotated protein n=1 Tax=freshwater metagenome TaxID=449393 RepID=A0A6J7RDD9_9ZZZZ|nr:hypothetical protein [Actinomycetota bacterium]
MTTFASPRILVAVALVGTFALAGCGAASSSTSSTSSPTVPTVSVPSVSLAPTGSAREVTFTTVFASKNRRVAEVGPDNQIAYGWNDLDGPTTFEGQPATVEFQGSIWFVNGSGPFSGFVTITLEDGSSLGTNVAGEASLDPTTKATSFSGRITVIGGTGAYVNSSGAGSWTGLREGAVGDAVTFVGSISLTS